MSIVALAAGSQPAVNASVLDGITNKFGVKITSEDDKQAYLLALESANAIVEQIDALPDYSSPTLSPVPCQSRNFSKLSKQDNPFNAWSHVTELIAVQPESRKLENLRVVIKDNISVAGIPYTCGTFAELAHPTGQYQLSAIDATVVKRLLLAGAKIVGTSTCENYSMTPLSYTSANGPVSNPWLAGYNAGGSSSGSACLLSLVKAKQLGVPALDNVLCEVDAALGGDQAGSIRLPASYCGIHGLKPTFGLVPYTGIAGLAPLIDHTGPMALSTEDCARMLDVLAGWDGIDPRSTPEVPVYGSQPQYHKDLTAFKRAHKEGTGQKLRVGIIQESLSAPGTSEEVVAVVEDAAMRCFAKAGAEVERVSVPWHLLAPLIWTAATRTNMSSLCIAGRAPDLLSHLMPHWQPRWPMDQEMLDLLNERNPAVINIAFTERFLNEKFTPASQAKAHRHVFQLRALYDEALAKYDVLITPTCPTVAPPLPSLNSNVLEKMLLAVGATNNTCPFNITGHPAMSVPCGWGKARNGDGCLPVGMQIIGRRFDDLTVLKAAAVFEAGGGGLGTWPGADHAVSASNQPP